MVQQNTHTILTPMTVIISECYLPLSVQTEMITGFRGEVQRAYIRASTTTGGVHGPCINRLVHPFLAFLSFDLSPSRFSLPLPVPSLHTTFLTPCPFLHISNPFTPFASLDPLPLMTARRSGNTFNTIAAPAGPGGARPPNAFWCNSQPRSCSKY